VLPRSLANRLNHGTKIFLITLPGNPEASLRTPFGVREDDFFQK
jgi:hypothetical protein